MPKTKDDLVRSAMYQTLLGVQAQLRGIEEQDRTLIEAKVLKEVTITLNFVFDLYAEGVVGA